MGYDWNWGCCKVTWKCPTPNGMPLSPIMSIYQCLWWRTKPQNMEGLRGTSTTITAYWYRLINFKPHSGISSLVFFWGSFIPIILMKHSSIAIQLSLDAAFINSRNEFRDNWFKETGCFEMCWDQFCSIHRIFIYIRFFAFKTTILLHSMMRIFI